MEKNVLLKLYQNAEPKGAGSLHRYRIVVATVDTFVTVRNIHEEILLVMLLKSCEWVHEQGFHFSNLVELTHRHHRLRDDVVDEEEQRVLRSEMDSERRYIAILKKMTIAAIQ